MINTKSIEAKSFVSKYIEPGVVVAKITKVESFQAATKTWGVRIHFETNPVEGLNGAGQTASDQFYLSEKATPITVNRLRTIADALGVRKQFDEIVAEESEFGNTLNTLFSGKSARWLFAGQEIPGKDGKPNWYKAQLYSGFSFVEPLSVTPTKLVYNPEVHLKPIKTSDIKKGPILSTKVEELY